LPRRIAPAPLLLAAVLLLGTSAVSRAQDAKLTLDDVSMASGRADFYGGLPDLRWLKTPGLPGPTLLETRRGGSDGVALFRVDPRTGASQPLYDAAKMEAALAALPGVERDAARQLARRPRYQFSADDTMALIPAQNDLFVYDFARERAARVTDSPNDPEEDAALAPDGRHVAFTRGGNLWVAPVVWGAQATVPAPRQLTADGGERFRNGALDWVYEEEVYGRGNSSGFRWSPDGKKIAFLRLDEAPVLPFAVVDHLPPRQGVVTERYPKAGDPNPVATLAVVDVTDDAAAAPPSPRYVDVSAYPDQDRLVVRFGFTPDSARLLFAVQNRTQTFLHLNAADPATGKATTLLKETSPAWVDIPEMPRFLTDGTFLWESDRTGFHHLYRYAADGKLIAPVTSGEWDVRDVEGVDEKSGWVYFTGSEHSAVAPHVYRVRLDGSKLARLSNHEGSHAPDFDPTFALYLDRWSDLNTPTQLRLHEAATGKEARLISENLRPAASLSAFSLSRPELVRFKARDGYPLDAILLKPTNFDPARRYPVFCPVYAGPQAPNVRDAWGAVNPWYHYLAQQGVIVWICDNRSATTGRGVKAAWTSHKNFGAGELRDIEDGLAWLKKQGWADTDRAGIYGWSFGGYMVEYALTHSKAFKVGIAGAGVSDWRFYDSIYTERYMGTPSENPDGYKASSAVAAAANLSGKLLLVHGTMDDNVHLQNTVALIDALERAGKDYQLQLYPRQRHGVGDPALSKHLRAVTTRFLLENL
jgi:dipeptidyl-peptidase-4